MQSGSRSAVLNRGLVGSSPTAITNMNREQPAKQRVFQPRVMGSTPIRFTKQCPITWRDAPLSMA